MAVVIEAISVVVRRNAIARKFPGGWEAFVESIETKKFCFDDDLARIGFMDPSDVESYVKGLEAVGLQFEANGRCVDLAVVDQMSGPTGICEWIQFGVLPFDDHGGTIAACWLFDEHRIGKGLHLKEGSDGSTRLQVHMPAAWTFEGSLSQKSRRVLKSEMDASLRFLRRDERGLDVYLDLSSGKEVYVGRHD
jgi:hypothetical protein